jgi:DNA (cytosine-5)-methyltransferase 1
LWREYARILGELRPRFAIVENVANLLRVDGGAFFGEVLSDLAAIGMDAWWDCLPASAVGAPHARDRIFIVAYARSQGGARLEPGADPCPPGSWRLRGPEDLRAIADAPFVPGDRWPQPLIRRVDARIPDRVARLRAFGNSVSPAVGYVVGRVLMAIAQEMP